MRTAVMETGKKRLSRRHYGLAWLTAHAYYRKITVYGAIRSAAPTLFIASHRNGATDGQIYVKALGRVPTLISVQLLRHGWLRLLFDGIAVVRDKDVQRYGLDKSSVTSPLQAAVRQIKSGGSVCIMPEGSSEWQPAPQPYLPGMAVIAARLQAADCDFVVQPLGIFYTCPDGFRSRVSVVRGEAFVPQGRDVRTLHAEFSAALNKVSVNCTDAATFNRIQAQAWQQSRQGADFGAAFLTAQHSTVGTADLEAANLRWWQRLAQGLFIAAFFPVVLAALVAEKWADGRNNVTFFRLLGALAVLPLLFAAWLFVLLWQPGLALVWILIGWLGWLGWPEPLPQPLPEEQA